MQDKKFVHIITLNGSERQKKEYANKKVVHVDILLKCQMSQYGELYGLLL